MSTVRRCEVVVKLEYNDGKESTLHFQGDQCQFTYEQGLKYVDRDEAKHAFPDKQRRIPNGKERISIKAWKGLQCFIDEIDDPIHD